MSAGITKTMDTGFTIKMLEEELLSPEARRSAVRLSELLDDEFQEFGNSGRVYTKPDILERPPREEGSGEPAQIQEFSWRALSAESGLATYRLRRDGFDTLRSSLWVRRGEGWRMFFHQGTRVGGVVSEQCNESGSVGESD